ncbi:MAG: hypothetical protein HOP23_15710 [Methylococcaceae bacterium]|nr:hypothetical protein [Methylococcaceae bacterium]
MNKPSKVIFNFVLIVVLSSLTACTPTLVSKPITLEVNKLGRIELSVTVSQSSLLSGEISQQVTKNLSGWNYPIGAKNSETFSHRLIATVGAMEHGDTPTGFSFSSGNSDPRALEFQKADVLPVNCQLTSMAQPEQTSELSMGFSTSKNDSQALTSDKLTDHISTVCFNLLRELKWPTDPHHSTQEIIKPSWIPEIRIETKDQPMINDTSIKNSEGRKQLIIHNQGSPVILNFGHERR